MSIVCLWWIWNSTIPKVPWGSPGLPKVGLWLDHLKSRGHLNFWRHLNAPSSLCHLWLDKSLKQLFDLFRNWLRFMRVRSKRQQRKVKAFLRFSARETKVLLIIDFELLFIVQVKGEIFAFLLKLIFTGFDICGMDVRTARSNANKCGIK